MEKKPQAAPAGTVKKILDEDEDKVVSAEEIARIFRIYLGRPASDEENARFEGIKESEWKILEKYVQKEKDLMDTQEKAVTDATKNQLDHATKQQKVLGDQHIDAMKNMNPMAPNPMASGGMMPPMAPLPPSAPNQTPPASSTGGTDYVGDGGKNFLVTFQD